MGTPMKITREKSLIGSIACHICNGLGAESSAKFVHGLFRSFPTKLGVTSHELNTPKIDQNGTLEELASEASEQVTTDSPGEWFQRLPLGMTPGFSEN